MNGQWRLAARNLKRNPRKSVATILSIALGAGGMLFTFGYVVRGERFLRVSQIYALHTGHLSIYICSTTAITGNRSTRTLNRSG